MMVTVLDMRAARPRHPEKVNKPDAPLSAQAGLDQGARAGFGGLSGDEGDRAPRRTGHGLRGGGLPEYRRVLVEEARDLHDHGRHLHAGLRLLQCAHRVAGTAASGRAGEGRATRSRAWACRMPSSPRSIATISTTAGRRILPAVIRAIRSASPKTTIEVLTPDFLRKDGALEQVVEARPDVFNHNLETVPSLYLRIRPGARYFHSLRLLQRVKELDPADVHQVRHHGGAWRRARRGAAGDGRHALGRVSISSPSASICSRRASTPRSTVSSRPTNSRPMRRRPMRRAF